MNEELVDKLQFYGKRWFARITLGLAIFLTLPTLAIMATWNTLPGEKMYPMKRYLESVALKLVGNNFTARADLQTQFVEQRFNEAETLLTQSSDTGLKDLVQQIQVTKTDIIAAREQKGGKDAIVAQQKADKLVVQLKEYNQKLEVSKESVAQVQPSVKPLASVSTNDKTSANVVVGNNTNNVIEKNNSVVITNPQVASTNVNSVEDAQQQIAKAIEELENKKSEFKVNDDKNKDVKLSPEDKAKLQKMIEDNKKNNN